MDHVGGLTAALVQAREAGGRNWLEAWVRERGLMSLAETPTEAISAALMTAGASKSAKHRLLADLRTVALKGKETASGDAFSVAYDELYRAFAA